MSIIRITEHSDGVEDYLENGRKKGLSQHRNDLDQRVPLYGDLEVFATANRYVQKNKSWGNNYWHITLSPAWIHNDMRSHEFRAMVVKTLECYFHLYERERLAAYAEIHYPKYQSAIDPSTQETKQRLPHVHLIVSKMDLWGINQLRILPYKKDVAKAFQALINLQYPSGDCLHYSPVAQQALKIVTDYQDWHKQGNAVDLDTIPYAPHRLLQSPVWQPYTKPDAESKQIFNQLNSRLSGQTGQTKARFNALQSFQQWLDDVACWYAEYPVQALLNRRASMCAVLSAAENKFGLNRANYEIIRHSAKPEEMALDTRTGKEYSAVFFAYEVLHLPMDSAIKWLKQLDYGFEEAYAEQENQSSSPKNEDDNQIRRF